MLMELLERKDESTKKPASVRKSKGEGMMSRISVNREIRKHEDEGRSP